MTTNEARAAVQQGLDQRAAARAAAAEDAKRDAEERAVHSIINQDSAAAYEKRQRDAMERLASMDTARIACRAEAVKRLRKRWVRMFFHNIVHHVGLAAIVYVGFLHGLPKWAAALLGLVVIISARDRLAESFRSFPKK